jgi:outer membrane immunogenic protein
MKTLRILLATGLSAVAFASAAQAADLIITPDPTPTPVVVSTTWDGPFVGIFAGYGWADLSTDDDAVQALIAQNDDVWVDPAGWLLGVNAGVNFTLTDGVVAGIVGDIAWADISDTIDFLGEEGTSKIDWLGSVRGRIGFDGGAFLPYLTAGLAFAHNEVSYNDVSSDNTHIGWTVGAGVEFAATENLSVDLLYRYSDYGSQNYNLDGIGDADASLTSHTLSVGLNFAF